MRLARLLVALTLALFAIVSSAGAEIIYYDNFDGPSGSGLNGTVPDITPGGQAWVAGQYVEADGTFSGVTAGNMFTAGLPFTPSIGKIYELSARVDNYGDWVAVGFMGAGFNAEGRMLFNDGPVLWALVRPSGAGNKDQAFIGPSTTGGLGDATTSSAEELMVRIETNSETSWVVSWYFDGKKEFQRLVDPAGLNIGYAAFGSNGYYTGVTGSISSFKLEEIEVPAGAWYPSPEDEEVDLPRDTVLNWRPGIYADKHDVYVGTNIDDVNHATRTEHPGLVYYSENQDANSYAVTGLVPGSTYYWRIDEVNEAHPTKLWKGDVWSFTIVPPTARVPVPVNGRIFVNPNVQLSWIPGPLADKHDVYIGTDFDTVNDADRDDQSGLLYYSENQDTNSYPAGGTLALQYGQTYYWRIDEVNDTDIWKGEVWQFRTMDFGGGALLGNWEQSMDGWFRWYGTTAYSDTTGVTLGSYSLRQELTPGEGYLIEIDLATIPGGVEAFLANHIFSIDVTRLTSEWTGVGSSGIHMLIEATGSGWVSFGAAVNSWWSPVDGDRTVKCTWDYSTSLDTIDPNPTALRLFLQQDSADFTTGGIYYYDNARLGTPVVAFGPNPADGEVDVRREPKLSWTAGLFAAAHDIYFGTDEDAVRNATKASPEYKATQDLGRESFKPGVLEFDTTYYWRVDEANQPPDTMVFEGTVWSFTVGRFLVVDDFEDYNDTPPYTVWNAWKDGYGDPDNGSQVGHDEPGPYAERGIVHGGNQSMPLYYDNSTAGLSEATMTLTSGRDWTREGVKALSLWFIGYPAAVGSFTEGPDETYTMTATGADIWGTADQFHFAYKMLTGVGAIEAQVLSVDHTDPWALAGVMIRNTLEPGSKFAAVFITPENGCRARARLNPDADALSDTDIVTDEQIAIAAPYWVRLERSLSGNFTFYYSSNGSNWQLMAWSPQNIQMNTTLYVGLALTAHNATATCEAQFSNVTIEGNVTGDWMHQDIGIVSNDPEQMYVALANNAGTPAVLYHDDPNAALVTDWTEWNIDLKDFEGQGVNLTDVNSITIGFGNKADPQASGNMGTMFFDDIRLYWPRCVPDKLTLSEADLNSDCVVDLRDLEIMVGDWLLADEIIATTAPSADGLVGYWMLDGNANDSSGNGNHGTLNGSPQWISAGQIDGALQLDGVDDYVDCANDVSLDVTDAVTLSTWVNTNDTGNGEHNPYVCKGDTSYAIKHHTSNSIEFFIYDGAWYTANAPVDSSFNGEWHHVAGTYDGAQVKVYVDGGLRATTDYTGSIATNTFPVNIARNSEATDRFYDGLIDDVRIYSRALSKAEIAYLGDTTPGDGQVYVPLLSSAELYGAEPQGSKSIDFKDFAVLADQWLDELLWPQQ